MKTLISALGAAVLGLFPLNAQFLINPYKVVPPSAGDYVEEDAQVGTTSGSNQVGNSALNTIAAASEFTPDSSYIVTRVDVYVSKNGSPTQTAQVEIWSQSGSLPSVIVGTASAAVSTTTFPASEGAVTFYPNASITSGTPYYIVLRLSAMDATNYVLWHRVSVTGRIDVYNPAGMGTWSNNSTTRQSKFKAFSSS